MAIVTEEYELNGRTFIRTYSDSGRYIVGGEPYGEYGEANDPAEFNRQYVEGDPLPPEEIAEKTEEIINILMGVSE